MSPQVIAASSSFGDLTAGDGWLPNWDTVGSRGSADAFARISGAESRAWAMGSGADTAGGVRMFAWGDWFDEVASMWRRTIANLWPTTERLWRAGVDAAANDESDK